MIRRVALLACLVLGGTATGQGGISFEGLGKKKPKSAVKRKPPATIPAVAKPESTATPAPAAPPPYGVGERIVAVPPLDARGKIDADLYTLVWGKAALQVGARLVPRGETLAAIEKLKLLPILTKPAARSALATEFQTQLIMTFDSTPKDFTARLYSAPTGTPDATAVYFVNRRKKFDGGDATALIADLTKKGQTTLAPPAGGLDLSAPLNTVAVPTPLQPPPTDVTVADTSIAEIRQQVTRPAPTVVKQVNVLRPTIINVFVGGGAALRSFDFGDPRYALDNPIVPNSPSLLGALAVNVRFTPLRLLQKFRDSPYGDLFIEGSYRTNLVQGRLSYPGGTTNCSASDYEALGRIGWRYQIPKARTRIGVSVGIGQEVVAVSLTCGARNVINSVYSSSEYSLNIIQPIVGEMFNLEILGGPRILFSTRAEGFDTLAWAVEGWLVYRPIAYFAVRAGARHSSVKQTTWPNGYSTTDGRTFVGLEVGGTY